MISKKYEQLFEPRSRPAPSGEARETYDERLNRILEAATEVIARAGYQRASMRAVARAAGVSLAGLYHYFDSKEKMLFLIQFRTFSSLLSNLREKLHGVEEPTEQLRVMVRAHIGYFAGHMASLRACSHELDSLSGEAYDQTRRIRREYYELTRSIVDRILDAHRPDGCLDRHVATMCLFGMLNWLYRWYSPARKRSPARLAEQIAAHFLEGLTGSARAGAAAPSAEGNPPPAGGPSGETRRVRSRHRTA